MIKYLKKNKDLIIRLYTTFALLLNLSSPLLLSPVYAQETPTLENEVVVKEDTPNDESAQVEESEQPETTFDETETEEEVVEESQDLQDPIIDDASETEFPAEENVVVEEEVVTEEDKEVSNETEDLVEPQTDTTEPEVLSNTIIEEETLEIVPIEEAEEDLIGMVCISDDKEIIVSNRSDWEVSGNVAETKDDVKLGVRYEFPLNNDVSVTFTCLPKDESARSHLRIEQVDLSEIQLPEGYETDAPYAYDITTEMNNGDFEYEITLPKFEDDKNTEIVYIEKSVEEVKSAKLSEEDVQDVSNESDEGDKVKARGLDHFTLFIPITGSPGNSPAVNIDQCENGRVSGLPGSDVPCEDSNWVNGNVNESKAHYYEDDSIPYRAVFKDLTAGATYTLEIEWDTTKGGKHAIDYLTSFDRTETDADPCSDIFSNCADGTITTFPIPADPNINADPNWVGTADYGQFKAYNATITGVSGYSLDGTYLGDSSTSITLTFTADQNDWVVLAWGGHISTREDWGQDNSAISISGSPYHMRLLDFTCSDVSNCSVGNQDLSLSASAVIFPGSITVVKEATPESSQQFSFTGDLGDFVLVDDGLVNNSITFSDIVDFTTYDITETLPTGWELTNIVCEDPTQNSTINLQTNTATVNMAEGENITCTFTNDQQEAYITVVKTVVNDNGGTLEVSDFPLFIDNDQVTSGVANLVSPGTYTVSETNQPGYTAGTWGGDCASDGTVTVAAGESKTCTITNNDIQPLLTVTKVVVNDNGGTLSVNDFPLFVDSTGVTSGVQNGFNAGSYVISETEDSGYSATISGDCDANGNVSLSVGDVKSCTVTNDDIGPTLTLIKTVVNDNGGTLGVSDFNLYIDGVAATSGQAYEATAGVEITVTEDEVYGYEASAWGGDCSADGKITLSPGENATCTITNDDIQPKLTVTKVVNNDDGGTATVANFPLFVGGTQVISGTQNGFDAGNYTVSETNVTGYEATISGDCLSDGSVTLNVGDVKSCTITNDDIAPTLTLIKIVSTDDGGDEDASDFQAYIDGNPVAWETAITLGAGSHTASESGPFGYTAGDWTGDCSADGTVTLGPGENKTCTITNDDVAPKLTLIKNVVNDNGGNAQPNDFKLTIGGNAATSGVAYTLQANVPYAINETQVSGYEFVEITGDAKCPSLLGGAVILDEGDDITCTITNDDEGSTLTVVKNVVNDNGGSAVVGTFDIQMNAGSLSFGDGVVVDNTTTYTATPTVLSNTNYTLSEIDVEGYAEGTWSCTDGTQGTGLEVTVNLDEGEDVTCTITNNDIQPTLKVTKVVASGDAQVSDFTLYVDQTVVTSGEVNGFNAGNYVVSEAPAVGYTAFIQGDCDSQGNVSLKVGDAKECTIVNVRDLARITVLKNIDWDESGQIGDHPNDVLGATSWTWNVDQVETEITMGETRILETGEYTLFETAKDNYHIVGWTCDNDTLGTSNEINVTLERNDNITCTFTNAPDKGSISGYKFDDRNGDGEWYTQLELGASGWTIELLELDGTTYTVVDTQVTGADGSYEFSNLVPGTYYVREVNQVGWIQTLPGGSGILGPIVISPAGTSQDNNFGNFKLVTVSGYKFFDFNANGSWDAGEDPIENWRITLDGTLDVYTDSTGYYEFTGVLPGNHVVSEENRTGWVQTIPAFPNVYNFIAFSGSQLTNYNFGNVQLGSIHGVKWDDLNGNGEYDCDFNFETTNLDQEFSCEPLLGDWTIFLDENANGLLDAGEQSTTTDSDPQSPHYGWYWFEDLYPGTYTVCEVLPAGWLQTFPSNPNCHEVSLPDSNPNNFRELTNAVPGPAYDFGNRVVDPELSITKQNNTGGVSKTVGDQVLFTITVSTLNGSPLNVKVVDLLSDGFEYIAGSWTAVSNIRGNLKTLGVTTEPTYASPGTWNLGNMDAEEVVTLTYLANITSSVDAGTYKDLAWAEGENVLGDQVLAQAQNPGFIDDNFVGTDVTIEVDPEAPVVDADVEEDVEIITEVLGASTYLPATGADTNNLYAAGVIFILGVLSLLLSSLMKRNKIKFDYKKVLVGLIFVLVAFGTNSSVEAAGLTVRMEDPDTAFNQPFEITFVALDILDRNVDVECYVKQPGAGSFSMFGPVLSLNSGGDSGVCNVTNSVLGLDGTYTFKVKAYAGEDSVDSQEVSVLYDGEGPERPKRIDVNKENSCKWEVEVETHADGDTAYIEVYAWNEKKFDLNNTTRIETINVGPDEEVEFDHEVYGSECGKTLYFAVRAFDAAGNASEPRSQEITETKTKTEIIEEEGETEVTGAIPVSTSGSILGDSDTSGQGGGTDATDSQEEGDGEILGDEDVSTKADTTSSDEDAEENGSLFSSVWFWIVLVLLAIVVLNGLRKRKK